MGYKKKATNFILHKSDFVFSVNLPRSSWNSLTDRPKEFCVDLGVYSFDKKISFTIPLFRLTKEVFPSFYGPFFLDKLSWTEKSNLMRSFNDNQISEIDKYRDSLKWLYGSEECLIKLLNEVKEQLTIVGLPTLDFANNYLNINTDTKYLIREMRKKREQLYLAQLDSASRFPTD